VRLARSLGLAEQPLLAAVEQRIVHELDALSIARAPTCKIGGVGSKYGQAQHLRRVRDDEMGKRSP
jgi:hypothetical protein